MLAAFVSLLLGQTLLLHPPWRDTEAAPHGKGNLYAPELVSHQGRHLLYYGAQGKDGHDRIHLAISEDGTTWKRQGVVLEDPNANHVNDPSVVVVDGVFHLFYTLARAGIRDVIAVATSTDGIHFSPGKIVLDPGPADAWDSLLVGRPSVLHTDGKFLLWYDGRKDLPLGAPDTGVPKAANSRRFVGLATSRDGKHFDRAANNPVFGQDAGGIHVSRVGAIYVMVYEGGKGTSWAKSSDGLAWTDQGLLAPAGTGDLDRHGHVTPFLVNTPKPKLLVGAAMAKTWDQNRVVEVSLQTLPSGWPKD